LRQPLIGFVDSFRNGSLAGWVKSQGAPMPLKVALMQGDRLLREAPVDMDRPDVGGHHGYLLTDVSLETLLLLVSGELSVMASPRGHMPQPPPPAPLRIAPGLYATLLREVIGLTRQGLGAEETLAALIGAGLPVDADRLCLHPARPVATEQTSAPFEMRVGTVSRDEASIVGHDGHLFLYKGNNYLLEQYQPDSGAAERARQWIQVATARKQASEACGAIFRQFIIPEKTSVMPHLFPLPVATPTATLGAFVQALSPSEREWLHVFLDDYRAHPEPARLYRRIDAHLSPEAAQLSFNRMLEFLGVTERAALPLTRPHVYGGDIGGRFPGIVETLMIPDAAAVAPLEAGLRLVAEHTPPEGGHEGIMRHYVNPSAPIPRKVIAFANSFFALGVEPHELSWWFARFFQDFRFVWSRNINAELIRQESPDMVIGQTIERFLPVIPTA